MIIILVNMHEVGGNASFSLVLVDLVLTNFKFHICW
jgi:hypothetical protein